jgi:hypothetical protein
MSREKTKLKAEMKWGKCSYVETRRPIETIRLPDGEKLFETLGL